jgi:hypothetical protein
MKYIFILLLFPANLFAQLYIAPGDSISILPGTLFTLQENLVNNGKIFNGGVLTLNGSSSQTLDGTGSNIDNLTVNNNTALLSDASINNAMLINTANVFDLGNHTFSNGGSVNGTGFLKGSLNATINLTGSGTSNINFEQSNNEITNAVKNFTVSNGAVTISNKLYVYDALLPNSGGIILNDELVLRSNISRTARVGVAGSSFTYGSNGKFVIERYIPGRRAWRLLTAPVTPATNLKISEAWQDNAPRVTNINIIDGTNNPNPGYGTHVTYGFPATNGYDQGINGNPSIIYLKSTGWNGVPSATNNGSIANSGIITDQPGYMLFVRGGRGTLLSEATGAATSPTVLRPKGKINTGTISQPLGTAFVNAGSAFRVVGNPYPSAINFHEVATNAVNISAGFSDAFYLWDPNITGNNGVGGFVGMQYNEAASIAAGKPLYDRSFPSSIDSSGNIQSGAAFIVDYAGAATTMEMEENDKSIESNNTFFRPKRQLQTLLLAENEDGSTSINDGALIIFDENINSKTGNMKKLGNFAENISVQNKSALLCIEKRKTPVAGDTIFYAINKMRQKKYKLQLAFDEAGFANGIAPFLEDNFLQQQTALYLDDTTNYGFAISTDNATSAAGRFRIVFKEVNRFVQFKAIAINNDVQLQWAVTDTSLIVSFEVQRSVDSIHFSSLLITDSISYDAIDLSPKPGEYFYRIKCTNNRGVVSYSQIQKVVLADDINGMNVYPNPITNKRFTLTLKDAVAGTYTLKLLNAEGKEMLIKSFHHGGGRLQQPVSVPFAPGDGLYMLELKLPGNFIQTTKLSFQHQ